MLNGEIMSGNQAEPYPGLLKSGTLQSSEIPSSLTSGVSLVLEQQAMTNQVIVLCVRVSLARVARARLKASEITTPNVSPQQGRYRRDAR